MKEPGFVFILWLPVDIFSQSDHMMRDTHKNPNYNDGKRYPEK